MSIEDKTKWDNKYKTTILPTKILPVVKEYSSLAKGQDALDIACGMGRHSRYLVKKGFRVDALDISPIALETLSNVEGIYTKEVDFDTYRLKENRYDLIICINFLKRELFPQIYNALKGDGIFIFESFVYHSDNTKAPQNRSFLLEQGEIESLVGSSYEILYQKEFWDIGICGDKLLKASFVGRKK
jgi:SAM-dependent methyltransferase